MKIKTKILATKILTLILTAFFLLYISTHSLIVFAQEASSENSSSQTTQTQTNDSTETEDSNNTNQENNESQNATNAEESQDSTSQNIVDPETNSESNLSTGNSNANSLTQTGINNTENNLNSNTNSLLAEKDASVSAQTISDSNTGKNEVLNTNYDTNINSGNSQSASTSINELNTNETNDGSNQENNDSQNNQNILEELNDETSPNNESTQSSQVLNEELVDEIANQTSNLLDDTSNSADLKTNTQSQSNTGENIAIENDITQILTGDSTAQADVLNLVNMELIASNFDVLLLNLNEELEGDIDLNAVWKKYLELNNQMLLDYIANNNLEFNLGSSNTASVSNNVDVQSSSGTNLIEGASDANLDTGNSYALANVSNFINLNLINSNFLFSIINILSPQSKNIILPRPELFQSTSDFIQNALDIYLNSNDSSLIDDEVNTLSNSGGNNIQALENSSLTTGNARAINFILTLTNLKAFYDSLFFLKINNLEDWTGSVINGSSEIFGTNDASLYQTGSTLSPSTTSNPIYLETTNTAYVTNDINVQSNSGDNDILNAESANLSTGNSVSLANLFNLVNATFFQSRWFMSFINILGDWSGNLIFAYPDVAVSVSSNLSQAQPGDTVIYKINYKNNGYDEAKNTQLDISIPQNATASVSDTKSLGTLQPGEEGSLEYSVVINDSFLDEDKNTTVNSSASISTSDPEKELGNNNSSAQTTIYLNNNSSSNNSDSNNSNSNSDTQTVSNISSSLEIQAINNSSNLYPGDNLDFTIYIKNPTSNPIHNVIVYHKFFDTAANEVNSIELSVGTVEANKQGELSFQVVIPADNSVLGSFYTQSTAVGTDTNNNQVYSNTAQTSFSVLSRNQLARVLGANDEQTSPIDVLAATLTNSPETLTNTIPIDLDIFFIIYLSVLFFLSRLIRKKVL
jgi:hypothetical protein